MPSSKIISCILLVLFATLLGHIATRIDFPEYPHRYTFSGEFQPMHAVADEEHYKTLYFRRSWHLSQIPSNAWLKVIGRDDFEVFVNNRQIKSVRMGHPNANTSIAENITHLLRPGENCIAISVWQKTFGSPPAIAVDAGYQLQNGNQRSLGDPNDWRYHYNQDRRYSTWYEPDFDDTRWRRPVIGDKVSWRAFCDTPPEVVSNNFRASWIRPRETVFGSAALRRTFQIEGKPRHGWLRLITTAPYALAINGTQVVDKSWSPSTKYQPMQMVYDIGPLLQPGRNTIAIELVTPGCQPHVKAELTATDSMGQETRIQTDEAWLSLGGRVPDWHAEDLDTSSWDSAPIEQGNVGVLSWTIPLEFQTISLPAKTTWDRLRFQFPVTVLLGLFAAVGSWITHHLLNRSGNVQASLAQHIPFLALVPTILIASLGILAQWDSAVSQLNVYCRGSLVWLVALPVLQWVPMVLLSPFWTKTKNVPNRGSNSYSWVPNVLFVAICFIALGLRVADIYQEPIHHDEIGAYLWTLGVWERGFPSIDIHPGLPIGYSATSELVFVLNAPMVLFSDDPRTIIRVPAVFWSIATLVMLYDWSRRRLGFQVALVASVIYAVTPYLVAMSVFGRYFAQLQFFAMLSIFAFWETIRGSGPINRRALWLTAFAFCCMFLSWEGSALIAPGMVLATLVYRSKNLKTIFLCPSIYASVLTVGLVVGAQNAHRLLIQSQRLIYGAGIDLMSLTPMWRNQYFLPTYYIKTVSWVADALLPLIALVLALGIALYGHRAHAWLRAFLIISLTPIVLMTLLLPLRSVRYSYHLTPVFILIFAFVLVRTAATLSRFNLAEYIPGWVRIYTGSMTLACIVVMTVLVSGYLIQTDRLTTWTLWVSRENEMQFPDWTTPFQYVHDHLQEGDIVISVYPHLTDELLGRRSDYWLQTTMKRQATLDDRRSAPLERGSGAPVVVNRAHLEQIFKQNKRIWYCTIPFVHNDLNDRDVSAYLCENMNVVCEGFKTSLLLRDNVNRPADARNKIRRSKAYLQ